MTTTPREYRETLTKRAEASRVPLAEAPQVEFPATL